MDTKRPLLVLIDASSFIFRAFYAIRQLSTKAGIPTNATFGFANMILKVLEDLAPTHIAVVYDTKHPSFRKERYAEYKANRSEMPDELQPQIPYIKKFVEAMGLPRFEKPGLEADDIIAALAHFARKKKEDVCIVSSDKDLMQLVNEHTWMFDTMKNLRIGPQEVKEKMGVGPELIADYLGIVGDSSDNIPGVKGIGPKGAVSLLEQYGNLEGIYANLDNMKPNKQLEHLKAHKESAFLSRELATVRTDVGIDFDWKELEVKPVFGDELKALLAELEFTRLADRIAKLATGDASAAGKRAAAPAAPEVAGAESAARVSPAGARAEAEVRAGDRVKGLSPRYECITSLETLDKIFAKYKSAEKLAFDTETTGLGFGATIVGFSFCAADTEAFYVPLYHEQLGEQCEPKAALDRLAKFLKDKRIVGQNLKYDMNILRRHGVVLDPDCVYFDTMIASYVLEPSDRHNMDDLSEKYLGHTTIKYKDVCGSGKSEISFAQVDLARATEYAAEDAHVTWLLYQTLAPLLAERPALERIFREIELPLVPVLADMEWAGVKIDKAHLRRLSEEFADTLKRLEIEAYAAAGGEFNIASPKQLQEVLFEKLKLPTMKKTKTGYSTDVEVLQKLAILHDLPAIILNYREVAKLKSTYVDVLPELADAEDRVHTNYQQTVAATGRLSSSDPNLQNIPIRTPLGKKIREAFVPAKGCVLLGADYSQIELRILAHMCGDKHLKNAFAKGQDIHSDTAARVFHIMPDEVTPEMRRKAKAINFGLLYGKTAFSLAEELKITRKEATDIIDSYFRQYPTVKQFLENLIEKARETGYAETLYGRRRRIDGINDRNKMIRNMADRMATNTPIQGTAADLMKLAMDRVFATLKKEKVQSRMILQVHDELVLEVPESEVQEVSALVKRTMESAGALPGFPKIDVPLTVEVGTGKSWLAIQ